MAARKISEKAKVAYFDSGVDEPGFYVLDGDPEEDENGTEHHSNMTPGKRVYPFDEWFSNEPAPEEKTEEGES